MLRARLEAERLFLHRLPRAYTLTEADAVAEMRRSVPDFTAQEWQEYLLDGKLDFIYLNGQRLYHEDTCASLLKTQRALNARALAPYDEQKPRLEAVIRQVMAGGRAYRFRLRAVTSIADDVFAPDTRYRIHLPIPAQSMQQSAAEELHATLPILYTDAADAPQRTAYMELCAHENAPIVTEYAWTQRPRYVNPLDEAARGPVYPDARPVQAEDLAEQAPHICFTPYLRSLAAELRGSETDPVRIARRFYDFITTQVMYAYQRPYLLIEGGAEYTAVNLRGDCGLQALLFITLCRISGHPRALAKRAVRRARRCGQPRLGGVLQRPPGLAAGGLLLWRLGIPPRLAAAVALLLWQPRSLAHGSQSQLLRALQPPQALCALRSL